MLALHLYKATGSLEAKPIGGGQVSLITEERLLVLVQLAQDHTNYTDAELTQTFVEQTKVQVSVRSVRRALERIRFSRKKARTASERSRPDVVARRAYARTKIMPVLPVERTFFIDETGADLSCERATAWGPIGARVVVKSPANGGKRLSVISALTLEGMEAVDLYEGTLTGERFYSWVQLHLAPLIRPRDVVILDNASMHVHTEALALIESKGAFVFFLPPYSPDMNPFEEAWSKVKAHLRAQAARTKMF